eukprot:765643-Hanusia_phi.AAC.3
MNPDLYQYHDSDADELEQKETRKADKEESEDHVDETCKVENPMTYPASASVELPRQSRLTKVQAAFQQLRKGKR